MVGNKKFNKQTKEILQNYDIHLIDGGKTRQMSVLMDLNLVKNLTQKISLFTIQLDHFFQIIYSKNLLNF